MPHPFVQYAAYILRHKALILRTAPRYGVSLWTALVHDWTRFLPSEFFPSANYFYGAYQRGVLWRRGESPQYDAARDLHEERNRHHAHHWHGQPMDESAIREMLCDWDAAGQAKGNSIGPWYAANRDRLGLHPATLARIDVLLGVLHYASPASATQTGFALPAPPP